MSKHKSFGSIEIVPQIRSGLSSFCLASTSFEYLLLCKGQTEIKKEKKKKRERLYQGAATYSVDSSIDFYGLQRKKVVELLA
jgi:hypothetical protein